MSRSLAHGDTVYGMGLIGALVYNIQYADGFKEVMWGVFKSLFWPGFVVYEILSRWQL